MVRCVGVPREPWPLGRPKGTHNKGRYIRSRVERTNERTKDSCRRACESRPKLGDSIYIGMRAALALGVDFH